MAISDPTTTLAFFKSRVLCQHRDIRGVPCTGVSKAASKYLKHHGPGDPRGVPESNALWFYGLNHAVSLISERHAPYERLPDQCRSILDLYHTEMAHRTPRAFYYLLFICIREARHNLSITEDHSKMADQFGYQIANFFKQVNGGEAGIHSKFLTEPPDATLGAFVDCLRWQFYTSKWSGGFGGKAWGAVADCLGRFVNGEFSPEMMLDTIWTLAHNNGPIFNKGLLYCKYTGHLIRLLDIQRAGQIPEAVLDDTPAMSFAGNQLQKIMADIRDMYPGTIGQYVDWYVVEALGAVGTYNSEKKQQDAAHGPSEQMTKIQAQKKAAEKAKAEAAKLAELEYWQTHFYVDPGLTVPKIKMERKDVAA